MLVFVILNWQLNGATTETALFAAGAMFPLSVFALGVLSAKKSAITLRFAMKVVAWSVGVFLFASFLVFPYLFYALPFVLSADVILILFACLLRLRI